MHTHQYQTEQAGDAYQVEGKGEKSDREYETDDANPGLQLFEGAFSYLAVHASKWVRDLGATLLYNMLLESYIHFDRL